jgi:Peptidase MA superfamily/Tetratricopeptide repeat
MRAVVTFVFCLLGVVATCAHADIIHLKNGRAIWADQVRQNGSRVEYDVGDDTYAVPKSAVDRVESGGVPPDRGSSRTSPKAADVPAVVPTAELTVESSLADKIVKDDKVDSDQLTEIERRGDAKESAAAYFIAGKHEFDKGNFRQSRTYFESAVRLDPQNPAILNYYAALLVRTGNAAEALPYAEQAVRIEPDSPDALAVLGYAQFALDRNRDAMRSWKRSVELRPDAALQQYLDKAQREARAEADYSQRESSHFTLHYEGQQSSDAFRRQLLATLESDYDDLVRQLGVAPRISIPVVLYTGQAFFDVTRAPSWSGALNDGKLRIPIEGLGSVTPELAHVLKHELAHSFINQISGGRCPQWLHEGIAQALEPKTISSSGHRLAQLFAAQREIPFNALEGSFMGFSGAEATLAYDESLAAVQYIAQTYGVSELRRILERLAQGSSTEAALRSTIHSDYGQLEIEVGKYLTGRFGS